MLKRILFAFVFTSWSVSAFAQTVAVAQLSGTVRDSSGGVLPGVEVTATQTDTGVVRTAFTNENGAYVLPNLPIGPYRLSVVLQGFNTYVQEGIVLQVQTNPTVDVTLNVGQVSEQVTVTAAATMIETRSTGVGQVIDNQRVVELPLNGRQATELIFLSGLATSAPAADLNTNKNYPTTTISVAGGHPIAHVVTFGAPRVAFLKSTAKRYNATRTNVGDATLGRKTLTVVNRRDPVPRLPPAAFGYRNVGRSLLVATDGSMSLDEAIESSLLDLLSESVALDGSSGRAFLQSLAGAGASDASATTSSVPRHAASANLSTWKTTHVGLPSQTATAMPSAFAQAFTSLTRALPWVLLPFVYLRLVALAQAAGQQHLSRLYAGAFPFSTTLGRPRPATPVARATGAAVRILVAAGFAALCWLVWRLLT